MLHDKIFLLLQDKETIMPIHSFSSIASAAEESIKKTFPVETDDKIIELKKVWVHDNKLTNDYPAQKEVKKRKRSWTVPVYGSLSIKDKNTGKVIDSSPKIKLMNLNRDQFSS